jgi:peptide/nickel transport system substrate-binding protein/oligopeptide transport system substrate-binding protein
MLFPHRRYSITTFLYTGVLVAVFVVGCKGDKGADEGKTEPATPATQYGGVYRKALENEPITLDPAFITDIYAVSVAQQLFDGLVQFDADLNVIPSIAKFWMASRQGLVWTFHLRQGVKFHHGREVTAEDFVYSFTRFLDPQIKSPRSWLFERVRGAREFFAGAAERVEGLQALDHYTLQITLSQPYAPFITMLGMAQPKVVPREEVERLGTQFGRQPVGTGPFRFVNWRAGQDITLEANREYFEGRPFLDHLHYKIFPAADRLAMLAEFEQGHLEDVRVLDQERQRLVTNPRYHFVRKPTLTTLFLWLNTRDGPLGNLKVRQAINYAIDRHTINSTIRNNRFVQARGILPPGMPGYNPELPGYEYNPQRARQLLAEADYPEGQGLRPLELWTSVTSPTARAEHKAIKRDLQHIGVTVELHATETWQQFTELLGKRPRAMYRYAWHADFPDPDNFLFTLFHSQSTNNYANYSNPEVDRLIEQAQHETDYLKRLQLYRQTEALIMADAPAVTLVHYTFEHLFQPYVRQIELNALGERYIPMKKIWLDKTPHASAKTIQSH